MHKNTTKNSALGKGLNALLGDMSLEETKHDRAGLPNKGRAQIPAGSAVISIDPNLIDPNPEQPRRFFAAEDLTDLSNSIKHDGILQPLVVSKTDKGGRFTLIAGERRLRASKIAGLTKVPVIIKEVASDDLLRLALIENIQRADLNIIEEGLAYKALINNYGLTQEKCSQQVGKDRSTIANALRILTLPKEVQDDVVEKKLTMGHARALLSLDDKKKILRARDIVVAKGLNVRQTEQLTKTIDKPKKQKADPEVNPNLEYLAESLRGHLRTKVKFVGDAEKGKIEISYFSPDELERIIEIIK